MNTARVAGLLSSLGRLCDELAEALTEDAGAGPSAKPRRRARRRSVTAPITASEAADLDVAKARKILQQRGIGQP